MPILGLGEFPFGDGPMGLFLEESDATPEAAPGERFLDSLTGDYAIGPNGEILRGSAARQRMIIALLTRAGTSLSVRGVNYPPVHNENTARLTEMEVREAVKPQVDDGTVQIDRIVVATEVDRVPGRLGVEVQFTNLETGEPEEPVIL